MTVSLSAAADEEAIAYYKLCVGRRIRSLSLIADGKDPRSDALTSIGAFASDHPVCGQPLVGGVPRRRCLSLTARKPRTRMTRKKATPATAR